MTACAVLPVEEVHAQRNGSRLDAAFHPNVGQPGSVKALLAQSDGRIVVAGNFQSLNGVPRRNLARLNSDGSLDTEFDSRMGAKGSAQTLAMQRDGKILVGGFLSTINGSIRTGLARLNADGSLDANFSPRLETNANVSTLAIQSDGKILLGGRFATVNGLERAHIARLNADGSVDASFNPGLGTDGDVFALAVQNDGRVIVGGNFNGVNGVARNRLARLNADGSLDATYDPNLEKIAFISALALQRNGKLMVGGGFRGSQGATRGGVARLDTNGLIELSYKPNPEIGEGSFISALAVQGDDKVFVSGGFTNISGSVRYSVARLDDNGNIDASFGPALTTDAVVQALALASDGRLIIGGGFFNVEGAPHHGIARLLGQSDVPDAVSKSTPGAKPLPTP